MSSATMKAVQIARHGGPEVMQLNQIPIPEPGKGKVRVRVEACGLNFSDIMIRGGTYIDRMQLPYTLGREFCGVVDAVGPEVANWEVGQRVVGSAPGGALAEFIVVQAATLIPAPPGLSPAEGASFLVQGITAVHCLEDLAQVHSGETVLIHAAAGGVGTLAVQIARSHGANVFGTVSSQAKCDLVRKLHATPIRYDQGDWVADFLKLTDGWGAHVVLESVGGEVFRRSFLEALAPFGRMVVFGLASGEHAQLSNVEILSSNKALLGYYLGSYFPQHMDKVQAATLRLMQLLAAGTVKPIVGQTFPLAEAPAAFQLLQSRQSTGKVIVTP